MIQEPAFNLKKIRPSFTGFLLVLLFISFNSSLSAQTRTSVQSGIWSNKNTWDCNCIPASTDNAIIAAGHTVTFNTANTVINLTINSGGILTDNGFDNTISGNITINGTYSGTGGIILSGINTTIDGAGSISNTAAIQITTGNKTIPSTANLTKNTGDLSIKGAITVTNNGTITIGGSITGSIAGSTWTNASSSTLNIGNALLTTGTLNASASGNTVNYYGSVAQSIKSPSPVSGISTYYHLIVSGSGTKTLPSATVSVDGNVTISSTLSGNGLTKILHVKGNWINNNSFFEGAGTVVFDGTNNQSISRSLGDENFNNLTINKSSGVLTLNTNVIVGTSSSSLTSSSTLTMTAGNIDVGVYTLTLGRGAGSGSIYTGTLNYNAGTIIGQFKRFINATGVDVVFPIGTASQSRTATINFNNINDGSLVAKFNATSPGNSGLPLTESGVTVHNAFRDGYWSFTAPDSLTSTDYNLQLNGTGFTGFTVVSATRLLTRSAAGNPWTLDGIHSAATASTAKRLNVTTLPGEYAFGDITDCVAPTSSSITGNSNICAGASGEIYSVTNNATNTYAWTVTGGTIASGQGSSTITVNWGSTGVVGSVSVVETNSCTSGPEVTLSVNVNPIPATTISGKLNVPQNGVASVNYSVPSQTNYTFTWTVSGGTIASGQGTNTIAVNWGSSGTGSVCVVGNHSTCGISTSKCISINIYTVIASAQSGGWSQTSTWDCACVPGSTDNVTIKNTHTVTLNNSGRTVNHLNINSGGTLSTLSRVLIVSGDFNVNGVLTGTTGSVTLSGVNTDIDGTGSITNPNALNITASKIILSSASLTKSTGVVNLSAEVSIANNGTITFGGDLTGTDATSVWTNGTNATLNIGGALLSAGVLNASATGNTIHYSGTTAQTIKTPGSSQYYNLSYSSTGVKTAPAATIFVGGNLTSDGTLAHNNGTLAFNGTTSILGTTIPNFNNVAITGSLTSSSSSINIAGNFVNNGTFTHNSGTVNFNGTSTISGSTAVTQFKNIIVSGALTSPTDLYISGDFKNNGIFNHNNGTVNFNGTSTLTGTSTINFKNIAITAALTASSQTINVSGDITNTGTFTHNSGTVNFNGSSSILGSADPLFYNVIVSNVLNSPALLNIAGDLTNNGTFNASTGKVRFAGTATQYVKGSAITNFNDLTVSNTANPSVSIETGQNLLGILSLESNTKFDADGSLDSATFTLISKNDTLDARIATIPTGASVVGKVKVQRYMSGEGRIYRYLSSPVTNATVKDWMDDFPVTGNFKDPSAYPAWPKVICATALVSKTTSLYFYDETKPGTAGSGYVTYPYINTYSYNSTLQVGRGYVPFIRACSSATTVDVKGPVNQGTISIPVTYTNTINDDATSVGWNLVGNPYPSAIDWNLDGDQNGDGDSLDVEDGWSKVNIAAAIAVRDNGTGMVRYWDGDNEENGLTAIPAGVLASSQGFWVRAMGANPQLIIREGAKTTTKSEYFRRSTVPSVIVGLKQGNIEDKAYIKLRPTSKVGLDYWDAPKMDNEMFDISTMSSDDIPMAINAVPSLNCQSSIQLKVTDLKKGFYVVKVSSRGDFDQQYELTIFDKFTKLTKQLDWDEELSFEVTTDLASKASDRFVINFQNSTPQKVVTEIPASVCHTDGSIVITNSQIGITYSAWSSEDKLLTDRTNGNGGALSFMVSKENLAAGENTIVLKGENLCGVFTVASNVIVVENPAIDEVVSGKSCQSGVVNLSASSSGEGIYKWYETIDANASIFEGAEFETPVLEKTKTYYVSLVTDAGCESSRTAVEATIINFETPVITAEENVLHNSYAENVRWYFNNVLLADATTSTYVPKESGIYSAITDINGCEARADFEFLVTGVENDSKILASYPNPVTDKLYINVPRSKGNIKQAYFVNNTGVQVNLKYAVTNNQVIINAAELADGFYLLNLDFGNSISTVKVVKIGK
jgi:hypothetical protein